MPNYAIGSCYIVRQLPGAERVGGLEVKVRPKRGESGQIEVLSTDWKTGEPLDQPMDYIAEYVIEGIRTVADEYGLLLHEFDVTLQRFLWHPVDSGQTSVYRQAGRSAFRSAVEGLNRQDLK